MIELQTENYHLAVSPDEGGLLTDFRVRQRDGWINILRPRPQHSAFHDGIAQFGCFAMVPFANRLPGAMLPFGEGNAVFPVNLPSEGIAHHGTARNVHWQVEHVGPTAMAMTVPIRDASGSLLGTARQDVMLNDENGLRVTLSYRHCVASAMWCGLGLHPWLYFPEGLPSDTLEFGARGHFEMGPDHLPARHIENPGKVSLTRQHDGHNVTYSNWNGTISIDRPSAGLRVAAAGSSELLHCYVAAAQDSICAEPVTHRPNAVDESLANTPGNMRRLEQGETMSIWLALSRVTAGD